MLETTEQTTPENGKRPPTYDEVHRDIALSNSYRMELSKLLLTLATGLFAFSVTLHPTLKPGTDLTNLKWAWYLLALSMAGGLLNLYGWERFYISYRDYDLKRKPEEGFRYRKRITFFRRIARLAQFIGFIAGTFLMGYFTSSNI